MDESDYVTVVHTLKQDQGEDLWMPCIMRWRAYEDDYFMAECGDPCPKVEAETTARLMARSHKLEVWL